MTCQRSKAVPNVFLPHGSWSWDCDVFNAVSTTKNADLVLRWDLGREIWNDNGELFQITVYSLLALVG